MTDSPSASGKLAPLATHPITRLLSVLGLLFVFLVGVNGLGDGFELLGEGVLDSFFAATENPFIGLMVGVLATTLVQSSSVTTSLIVGFVAAPENPLPVANAVPMVMGANIGTTVTNTIVSLAHMGRAGEFRRAFAVATCHDFFNFLAVATLLPLEMMTGCLRRMATLFSSFLTNLAGSGVDYDSPIKGALKFAVAQIEVAISTLSGSYRIQGIVLIVVSSVLIFTALMLLVRVMRSAMRTRVESIVSRALDRSALLAMLVGVSVTVMVQSSSITTALLVPLAGAGLITLEQAFPITIGANVGTTVTALLAALAVTGPNAGAGITIALAHLLFNLSATALIYPVNRIRGVPLTAARALAAIAVKSRKWALIYVVALFYLIPAAFAVLNRLF
ncbi:MAG: Na/Pi symporter [Gemmatimonadota bacterium]|nr:MAG: Na/Pi symporter [Gemmatimonadota bacterium]